MSLLSNIISVTEDNQLENQQHISVPEEEIYIIQRNGYNLKRQMERTAVERALHAI
jgi:hypothetical protein